MYFFTLVFGLIFAISFWHDKRHILNPAWLILTLFWGYISILQFLYDRGFENTTQTLALMTFLAVPLIIVVSALFLIYNGIILLKKEGKSKANLLSLVMGIVILLFILVLALRAAFYIDNTWLTIAYMFFFYTYLLFGFAFVGYLLYSLLYLAIPKRKQYDFIIIHGAGLIDGLYPTPLLKKRIDKAVEAFFRSKNPNIKLIASGGQGGR